MIGKGCIFNRALHRDARYRKQRNNCNFVNCQLIPVWPYCSLEANVIIIIHMNNASEGEWMSRHRISTQGWRNTQIGFESPVQEINLLFTVRRYHVISAKRKLWFVELRAQGINHTPQYILMVIILYVVCNRYLSWQSDKRLWALKWVIC